MGRTTTTTKKRRSGGDSFDVWAEMRSLTTRVSRWKPWKRALLYGAAALMVVVVYAIASSDRQGIERLQQMKR